MKKYGDDAQIARGQLTYTSRTRFSNRILSVFYLSASGGFLLTIAAMNGPTDEGGLAFTAS